MVDDVERLRDLAHRLWIAEGRPDIPRHELMRRAADILARQERMLRNGRDTADIVHLSKAVSES
jgi:hypothetical protein